MIKMTDKQIIEKTIEIIGEFSENKNGEVVSSYSSTVEDLKRIMIETGLNEED